MISATVVICFAGVFKFKKFAPANAEYYKTFFNSDIRNTLHFKMYLWLIDKYRGWNIRPICRGCDLLSKCIFDLLINTYMNFCWIIQLLWFAFKMYLWLIDKYPHTHARTYIYSCDLLSKCIFDLLINTSAFVISCLCVVVICFQNVSLTYW